MRRGRVEAGLAPRLHFPYFAYKRATVQTPVRGWRQLAPPVVMLNWIISFPQDRSGLPLQA